MVFFLRPELVCLHGLDEDRCLTAVWLHAHIEYEIALLISVDIGIARGQENIAVAVTVRIGAFTET